MKIAIIGSGIAGMSAAYFLNPTHDITVFEKNNYIGGHTHTQTVEESGREVRFDSGFMVFNFVTYPNLKKLFEKLGVTIIKTDMSFSVQNPNMGVEFSGTGVKGLFADKLNVLRPNFYKFLLEINRFNRNAHRVLEENEFYTLAEFKERFSHTDLFFANYLIPMTSAVWSSEPSKVMDFPAKTLFRFFFNHGLLGIKTHHQWYTVKNGSFSYRDLLVQSFKEKIVLSANINKVHQEDHRALVYFADGSIQIYDKVIFACHADEALKLISNPSELQTKLLTAFRYQANQAVIHTDESLMPKHRDAWSSWNYRYHGDLTSTTYYMNRLQSLQSEKNYFVTINDRGAVDQEKIIRTFNYHHPLFNLEAIKSQTELPKLNEGSVLNFTGSYFKYGFHEDALTSSVVLCERILGKSVI